MNEFLIAVYLEAYYQIWLRRIGPAYGRHWTRREWLKRGRKLVRKLELRES